MELYAVLGQTSYGQQTTYDQRYAYDKFGESGVLAMENSMPKYVDKLAWT